MNSNAPSDRRQRALHLPRYLAELGRLAGRPVQAEDLGTPAQAAAWRELARGRKPAPEAHRAIDFSDLRSQRFKAFVGALVVANPAPVHVWTQDTVHCGVLVLPSLAHVHFDFEADLNDSGVIVLSTADHQDRLLLDWRTDEPGATPLQLEVAGSHWSQVRY